MAVVPLPGLQSFGSGLTPILGQCKTPIRWVFGQLVGTVAVEEGWFLGGVSAGFTAWYETNLVPEGWLLELQQQ